MPINCQSRDENSRPCPHYATETVWCPTWISAGAGPLCLCHEHAKNFHKETNPHSSDGEFYFGQAAYDAFERIGSDKETRSWGMLTFRNPSDDCKAFHARIGRTRCANCGRIASEHGLNHLGQNI